jgi:hypothetical protein
VADGADTLSEILLNSLVAGAAMQGPIDAALAAELTALSVSTQESRANAAQRSARATSTIPLRPEIVQFMSPQSLCRLTCCSATLRRDVCEADAWQRLAEVHAPRAVRAALESDAVSRVRSHVRRRVLADSLCQETRARDLRSSLNAPMDFTFFVRVTEDGRLIWEGDLKSERSDFNFRLPLSEACAVMVESGNMGDSPGDAMDSYLERLQFTVVVIRDKDQAMIPLGLFDYHGSISFTNNSRLHSYSFEDDNILFSTDRLEFRVSLCLQVTFGGVGTTPSMDGLVLYLDWQSKLDEGRAGGLAILEPVFLLTFLAGFHYSLINEALRTIDGWHDFFVRDDYGIPLRETFGYIFLGLSQEAADIQAAARREALDRRRAARNHLQNP